MFKLPLTSLTYQADGSVEEIMQAFEGSLHKYAPINNVTPLKGEFSKERVKISVRQQTEASAPIFYHPVFVGTAVENSQGTLISLKVRPSVAPLLQLLVMSFATFSFIFVFLFGSASIFVALSMAAMTLFYYILVSTSFWGMYHEAVREIHRGIDPIQLTRRSSKDAVNGAA